MIYRHNQANLGEAGHRMLNHYGAVPPPQMMRQQERDYDRNNQRGFNDQSGPYANPYQQRPGHHQSGRGGYGSYNNDRHGGSYNQERLVYRSHSVEKIQRKTTSNKKCSSPGVVTTNRHPTTINTGKTLEFSSLALQNDYV